MASRTKFTIFFILSGFFIVLGILMSGLKDVIFGEVFRLSMVLSPSSPSYGFWKDIPFPLEMKVYLWNVSNPREIKLGREKPKLTEIGPFVFKEYRSKSNIVWNHDNGTVSYNQTRSWVFDPEKSLPADTPVTILNVPAAAASKTFFNLNPILRPAVSLFLMSIQEKLFVTQKAIDIIFNGYEDPLLTTASKYDPLPGIQDKFAIFYERNNSAEFDGLFNIHTGESGVNQFGEVSQWNYHNSTGFFPSPCGDLKGGLDFLPPFEEDNEEIIIYSSDLCRPLFLERKKKEPYSTPTKYMNRISVSEYEFNSTVMFGNSSLHPENACFEGGHPLRSGVFNASSCRFGAPIFISNPHFLSGDPFYASQFSQGSMRPNSSEHQSRLKMEPHTGLLLEVHIKTQLNVFLRHVPMIELYENVKDAFFPVAWFDYSLSVTGEMAFSIWMLSSVPFILLVLGLTLFALGLCNIALGGIYYISLVNEEARDDNNRLFIDDEVSQDTTGDLAEEQVSNELMTSS